MIKFEIAEGPYSGPDAVLQFGKYLSFNARPDYRFTENDYSLDIFFLPYVNCDVLLAYKCKRNKKYKNGLYRVVILKEIKK